MSCQTPLARHPIFGRARPERLTQLDTVASRRVLEAGGYLVRPGAPMSGVFVLASGSVAVTRANREKKTRMLIGIMDSPGLLGDAELHSRATRWDVAVRATTKLVAVHLPGEDFLRWLEGTPEVALALYQDAASRLMLTLDLMQVFALQKLENKVLRLLWTASTVTASGEREAPLSPTRLAEALGVSARTVARHLITLERSGAIRRTEGRILLLTRDGESFTKKLERRPLPSKWRLPTERGL